MDETISVRVAIGSSVYTLDEVIDTEDGLSALRVGRGVSEAILRHGSGANDG